MEEEKALTKEEAFALVDEELKGCDTSRIRYVISTMAIEDMFLTKEFLNDLIKVEKGEKTSEQLRKELDKKFRRA